MAEMAVGGGMANANKYNNLSNMAYGIAGMGASAGLKTFLPT